MSDEVLYCEDGRKATVVCPQCGWLGPYKWSGNPTEWTCEAAGCYTDSEMYTSPYLVSLEGYTGPIKKNPPPPPKTITLISFSYKYGKPPGGNEYTVGVVTYDVRNTVRNPWRDAKLRKLTGLTPEIQAFVQRCNGSKKILERNFYDGSAIRVGCMGGKHRSVAIVELLAAKYREKGWEVTVIHRDLERKRGGKHVEGTVDGV